MNNILEKTALLVADLGSRLPPLTNLLPKATLPLYNKPALQYVVKEARRIDIENFNQSILAQTAFSYIQLPRPLGLGNALNYTKTFVNASPFLILLAENLMAKNSSFILKFKKCFENFKATIITVKRLPYEEINSYEIIAFPEIKTNVFEITKMYEKPFLSKASSNLATTEKYILTPDIFDDLKVETLGVKGKIQLTGTLKTMLKEKKMYAMLVKEERFDVKTWKGWFLANVIFCLKNPKEKNKLIASLEKVIKRG